MAHLCRNVWRSADVEQVNGRDDGGQGRPRATVPAATGAPVLVDGAIYRPCRARRPELERAFDG